MEESENNPEVLVKKIKSADGNMPKMYICCGTEDFLIEPNRQFRDFLVAEGVEHEYHESKGNHDMVFWSEYIVKVVEWMFA